MRCGHIERKDQDIAKNYVQCPKNYVQMQGSNKNQIQIIHTLSILAVIEKRLSSSDIMVAVSPRYTPLRILSSRPAREKVLSSPSSTKIHPTTQRSIIHLPFPKNLKIMQ